MTETSRIFTQYIQLRAKHGQQLRVEQPVDPATREFHLLKIFGVHAPLPVSEAYDFCNGFGLKDRMEEDGVNWILPPVQRLGEHAEGSKWFSDTHPDLTGQFHPVIFYDGNCIGYMKGAGELFESSVYLFSHEEYMHDGSQESAEFLFPLDLDLAGYLLEEMTYY